MARELTHVYKGKLSGLKVWTNNLLEQWENDKKKTDDLRKAVFIVNQRLQEIDFTREKSDFDVLDSWRKITRHLLNTPKYWGKE
tara:strand:- start:130 stop:381 length:252 start_codon:yes stop_codon:yes gene_type:complete